MSSVHDAKKTSELCSEIAWTIDDAILAGTSIEDVMFALCFVLVSECRTRINDDALVGYAKIIEEGHVLPIPSGYLSS